MTGVVRLAACLTLAVALGYQIIDKLLNNDMIADQYFMFFTIQSTIIAIFVLAWGAAQAFSKPTDAAALATARLGVLSYGVVTAVVYNVLLRGLPPEVGVYQGPTWPSDIMHVWVPIVLVLDWLLAPGTPRLRWSALGFAIIYPLAWLAATLARGALDNWYPYPFLDHQEDGWGSVFVYIVVITGFVLFIAAAAIVWSRKRVGATAS